MVDNNTVMIDGCCSECGTKYIDNLSCFEQFHFLLAWEHNDPKLYELHFWLVSCYMLQHPSNFTDEGYKGLIKLFIDAYDYDWSPQYILKKNRELVTSIKNITNPLPNRDRERKLKEYLMTISDIYTGGEESAIKNILKWKKCLREELPINIKE